MTEDEEYELRARLVQLAEEHRDLDAAIDNLVAAAGFDQLHLQRMKKRKLGLKDQMRQLESRLVPDIIA